MDETLSIIRHFAGGGGRLSGGCDLVAQMLFGLGGPVLTVEADEDGSIGNS